MADMMIPEGWRKGELSNFCDVVGGGTPDRNNLDFWGGDIPWASPTEITNLTSKYISQTKENITELGLDKSSAKLHPTGTLLMTSRASIGYVAINAVPMATNQGFQSLRCKENVLVDFLYQYIAWSRPQLERLAAGSTFAEISSANVKKLEVCVPPLPEQQKIATILTSVDTVIEKTRAQIDKLKHLKTGMMQELLTKGIGHTEFKNTPIGRIPKEWDVAAIADIARLTSGGTPNRENSDYWNGDVLWVKTGEVNYQTIFDTEEKITVLGLKESSAKLVPAGAILMAMYGQGITRGKVAKLGVPAAMNQACLAMIPNNQIINDFLYYFLSREYFNLRSMVQEGAQKNLSASIIKEILLPVPPRKEQQKIVDVLQSIDTKIMTASQKLISVEQTKKALMQDLLIGKIRVKLGSLGAFIE